MDRLAEVCKYGYPDYRITAGISVNDLGIHSLPRNYKRAIALLRIAERQGQAKLSYRNSGLFKLLIEIEDTKVLKRFYEETLGQLDAYAKNIRRITVSP